MGARVRCPAEVNSRGNHHFLAIATHRNLYRWSFPVAVFGNSGRNSI